ncbi:MAG TPA: methyltransferase domain-containing protein [Mycobacteriales bacterium]|nr:methyltransferase domain-containing protein [Mycobacteriales bacterium]
MSDDRYARLARGYGTHQAIVDLLAPGRRVLDVGAGGGHLAALVTRELGGTVVCLERDRALAQTARDRGLTVVEADITDTDELVAAAAPHGPFDHLILADVLEHVADPAAVLHRCPELLAHGGSAVVSLPNVVTLKARLRMLAGIWRYEDEGIFDATHLRFFSIATARALLTDSGWVIDREIAVGTLTHRMGRRGRSLTAARPGLLATQLVMRASPPVRP